MVCSDWNLVRLQKPEVKAPQSKVVSYGTSFFWSHSKGPSTMRVFRGETLLWWNDLQNPSASISLCDRQPEHQREGAPLHCRATQEASIAKSFDAIIMEVNLQNREIDVYPRSCSARERGKLSVRKIGGPGWRWCPNTGNPSISIFCKSLGGAIGPKKQLQAGPWMKESEKSEGFPKARKHLWRKKFDNLEKEAAWRPDC